MTNYTTEEIQEVVDQVNENIEEELYDDERCAAIDDVSDLLKIVEFLQTKNRDLTTALKLVDDNFPTEVLSDQMGEDYDTYKELKK